MPPRMPSATLVVDANIVLGVVLGARSRPLFAAVCRLRTIATSSRAVEEIRGVLGDPRIPAKDRERAEPLLAGLLVVGAETYANALDEAGRILADAVASRDASRSDAHLLACAWALDADIWSHDRDFAGTGWPSWSNANLRRVLEVEAG